MLRATNCPVCLYCCLSSQKQLFWFVPTEYISESKVKFRQVTIRCKRVLKAPKLVKPYKTKESITSQKLGCQGFWQISNSNLNKGQSAIPPLFNSPEVLPSASPKAELFAKHFVKNSNLKNSGIPLPPFPSRTNLKLHNISVTPKMVKKIILNLDSSKVSAPDCIPVVVLKNWWLEFSYILAKLFSMCLMESYFPDCWKVTLVVAIFQNLGQGLQLKTTALLVFFLRFIVF